MSRIILKVELQAGKQATHRIIARNSQLGFPGSRFIIASFSSFISAWRWRRSSRFFFSLSTSLTTLLRRLFAALLAPAPPPPTPTPPAGPTFWFWFWIADSIRPAPPPPFIERPGLEIIWQKTKTKRKHASVIKAIKAESLVQSGYQSERGNQS